MVSIIIPVYNAATYIDRCLESVVKQDYTEWECILVDDGSKDSSLSLCERWKCEDDRFIVLSQINGGVSSARNAGLNMAKGDYVCFIDSDDWVESGYISDMLESMRYAEMTVSGIKKHLLVNGIVEKSTVPYRGCIELDYGNASEFARLNENSLLYGPVNKMYRMDIIREENIEFPRECSYGEDLIFNFSYLKYVKKIAMVDVENYNYEVHENSLSQQIRRDAFSNDYKLWKIRKMFMKERKLWIEDTKVFMYRYLWGQVYSGLFTCCSSKALGLSSIKEILYIPEIEKMAKYEKLFNCSKWIKFLIVNRQAFLLYCVLNIRRWIFRV